MIMFLFFELEHIAVGLVTVLIKCKNGPRLRVMFAKLAEADINSQ